jgi:hypothetical protein
MELVDVGDSKSPDSDIVSVRVRPAAPYIQISLSLMGRAFCYNGFVLVKE